MYIAFRQYSGRISVFSSQHNCDRFRLVFSQCLVPVSNVRNYLCVQHILKIPGLFTFIPRISSSIAYFRAESFEVSVTSIHPQLVPILDCNTPTNILQKTAHDVKKTDLREHSFSIALTYFVERRI